MANPNPSPATRFRPGQVANPRGKLSGQRKAEIRNAERAAHVRGLILEAVMAELGDPDAALSLIKCDVLQFLRDTENRGLGTIRTMRNRE